VNGRLTITIAPSTSFPKRQLLTAVLIQQAIGDFTGGHLAAAELQGQQDVTALLVRERGEDRLEVCELRIGRTNRVGRPSVDPPD
jgi:hypothetical protein